MTGTLVRDSLDAKSIDDLLEHLGNSDELAATAVTRLGYRGLQSQLPTLHKEAAFGKALADLDIRPFNTESVKRYKAKMERRAMPLATRIAKSLCDILYVPFVLSLATCATSLVGCFIAWCFTPLGWLWAIPATSGATTIVTLLTATVAFACLEKDRLTAVWTPIRIDEYKGLIPEFALQTALDITERCPDAKFFVEELRLEERPRDPFLVAFDGAGNAYYLEVWNEPGFVQKREQ